MQRSFSAPSLLSLGQSIKTSNMCVQKSASDLNLNVSALMAGFHRDLPHMVGERIRPLSRRTPHGVESIRTHSLPFGTYPAVIPDFLLHAMISPTEVHRLLDSAVEQKQLIEEAALEGLEGLKITASTPHGLMSFECLVDTGDDLDMRTEILPIAPNLVDGTKGSDCQDCMEKAACLSTPLMLETESSSFKLLNMQAVQKLAFETEAVVVLSTKRNPGKAAQPDIRKLRAALEVDDLLTSAIDVPQLPLPEEERRRISSVYASHDSEAEPSNMLTLNEERLGDQPLDLHDAPGVTVQPYLYRGQW